MDRLDLELYAERLARLVTCAADDLADARLRLAWAELEDELAPGLAADDAVRLRGLGALSHAEAGEVACRAVDERAADLAALHRLQALVEGRRGRVRRG